MPRFILEFGAPSGAPFDGVGDREQHELDAETVEEAKVKAAILYAGASFKRSPPNSYRIVCSAGTEVYRFPEAG
ncbi:hypothetical protein [Phenylobacterium sp.]|uniref:hypothetical protein n=1 Tax=Phenylobacterium sp. TaxID=1871053 RepID=UPI002F3FE4E9